MGSNEIDGKFTNAVYPEPQQIAELQATGPSGAIVMVNLLKFKDKAEYPDGRASDLTGREAYNIYAEAVMPILEAHGGRVVYTGDTTFLALGACEPLWDEVALAFYPNRKSIMEMTMSAEWQDIAVHRAAGLAGQLNIETTPNLLPS